MPTLPTFTVIQSLLPDGRPERRRWRGRRCACRLGRPVCKSESACTGDAIRVRTTGRRAHRQLLEPCSCLFRVLWVQSGIQIPQQAASAANASGLLLVSSSKMSRRSSLPLRLGIFAPRHSIKASDHTGVGRLCSTLRRFSGVLLSPPGRGTGCATTLLSWNDGSPHPGPLQSAA